MVNLHYDFRKLFFYDRNNFDVINCFSYKKKNPKKSLTAIYCDTFISEGRNKKDTENMLKFIKKSSNSELSEYLGLRSIHEIIESLNEKKKEEMIAIFGSMEKSIQQGDAELNNLRESLTIILRNRILNKDDLQFPFYKVLNKLKHGYQIIPSKIENVFNVLIAVKSYETEKAIFEIIPIPFSAEKAKWFSRQTRIMGQVIQHLLMAYTFNL